MKLKEKDFTEMIINDKERLLNYQTEINNSNDELDQLVNTISKDKSNKMIIEPKINEMKMKINLDENIIKQLKDDINKLKEDLFNKQRNSKKYENLLLQEKEKLNV